MTNNTDRLPEIKAHFEGVLAQEPRADLTALRLDQLEWLVAELEQTRSRLADAEEVFKACDDEYITTEESLAAIRLKLKSYREAHDAQS